VVLSTSNPHWRSDDQHIGEGREWTHARMRHQSQRFGTMRLKDLFDAAGINKDGTNALSHRFRDTFAVKLLERGTSIESVSVLLGHKSIRITEKHYSPWVRSRQEALEVEMKNAWKGDATLKQAGTNRVQTHGPVN